MSASWRDTGRRSPGTGEALALRALAVERRVERGLARRQAIQFRRGLAVAFAAKRPIHFTLPGDSRVSLVICDVSGRLVRNLVERQLPAGEQAITWDGLDDGGRPVANGVLFIRLQADGVALVKRMVKLD